MKTNYLNRWTTRVLQDFVSRDDLTEEQIVKHNSEVKIGALLIQTKRMIEEIQAEIKSMKDRQ